MTCGSTLNVAVFAWRQLEQQTGTQPQQCRRCSADLPLVAGPMTYSSPFTSLMLWKAFHCVTELVRFGRQAIGIHSSKQVFNENSIPPASLLVNHKGPVCCTSWVCVCVAPCRLCVSRLCWWATLLVVCRPCRWL